MTRNYLISYDLVGGKSSFNYMNLHKSITAVSQWAKPLESVYIVKSNLSSYEIASILRKSVGLDDKLFVVEIGIDWTGLNLPKDVVTWLKNNL